MPATLSSCASLLLSVLVASAMLSAADAYCGTTGGGTRPAVNNNDITCRNCGSAPCAGASGACWSCAGSGGKCHPYSCNAGCSDSPCSDGPEPESDSEESHLFAGVCGLVLVLCGLVACMKCLEGLGCDLSKCEEGESGGGESLLHATEESGGEAMSVGPNRGFIARPVISNTP
jgi:hypothetical protein